MTTESPALHHTKISQKISTQGVDPLSLYGHNDANLIALESRFGVKITARGDTIRLDGDRESVGAAASLLDEMISCLRRGADVD